MSANVCQAMSEELAAYVDGEQTEPERSRIESHVTGCLTCRREIERIEKLNALVAALTRVEPSDDFEERTSRMLRAETTPATHGKRFRPALWGLPVLAAAAAVALAWYSLLLRVGTDQPVVPRGGPAVAAAPQQPARPGSAPIMRAGAERESEPALAASSRPERELAMAPEDLPPELLEYPELFLRYPVVRRMDKLEHFEEVRRHVEPDHRGGIESSRRPLG